MPDDAIAEFPMHKDEAIEKVQKGIAWLDENYPDWRDKMDWSEFSLWNTHCCVIGQLYGDYFVEVSEDGRLSYGQALELGFDAFYSNNMSILHNTWKELGPGELRAVQKET